MIIVAIIWIFSNAKKQQNFLNDNSCWTMANFMFQTMFMNKLKATFQVTCNIAFNYNEVFIIDN
jgi:hypothetical protein